MGKALTALSDGRCLEWKAGLLVVLEVFSRSGQEERVRVPRNMSCAGSAKGRATQDLPFCGIGLVIATFREVRDTEAKPAWRG